LHAFPCLFSLFWRVLRLHDCRMTEIVYAIGAM
jgi:hypothetical protein